MLVRYPCATGSSRAMEGKNKANGTLPCSGRRGGLQRKGVYCRWPLLKAQAALHGWLCTLLKKSSKLRPAEQVTPLIPA